MKTLDNLIESFSKCLYLGVEISESHVSIETDQQKKENIIKLLEETRQNISEIKSRLDLEKDPEKKTRILKTIGVYERKLQKLSSSKIDHKTIDKTITQLNILKQEMDSVESKNISIFDQMTIDEKADVDNRKLLNFDQDERLEFVTDPIVTSDEIVSGSKKTIKFFFDKKSNRDLFLKTTAGQVLPKNVREVQSGGKTYTRTSLYGEFFSGNERLIIRDKTKIEITKNENVDKIEKENYEILKNFDYNKVFSSGKITPPDSPKQISIYEEIVRGALNRGIDPEFAMLTFGDKLKSISDENLRRTKLEDMLTEFDRIRGKLGVSSEKESGKYNKDLALSLIIKFNPDDSKEKAKTYGLELNDDYIKTFKDSLDMVGGIDLSKIPEKDIEEIKSSKTFEPGSRECQILFSNAAKIAGVPESMANEKGLYEILQRESHGVVGILNYTLKGISTEKFKALALSQKKVRISTSNASGLGQLLLDNVDKFYPDGRKGIGDPMNEAVGMLRYIYDRYGTANIAWHIYGKTGEYIHPTKGKQVKTFKEGY